MAHRDLRPVDRQFGEKREMISSDASRDTMRRWTLETGPEPYDLSKRWLRCYHGG